MKPGDSARTRLARGKQPSFSATKVPRSCPGRAAGSPRRLQVWGRPGRKHRSRGRSTDSREPRETRGPESRSDWDTSFASAAWKAMRVGEICP